MKMKVFFSMLIALSTLGFSQSFELYNSDTINRIDLNKKKQGLWMIFGNDKKLLEQGNYLDNLKTGEWRKFLPNGKPQYEINFEEGFPNGAVSIYYPSGKLQEKGTWVLTKWVGEYQFYFQSGNVAYDWNFNKIGKRDGKQTYFYEDGTKRIEGNWEEGKTKGILKEYYENGSPRAERIYKDDVYDKSLSKIFPSNPDFNPDKNNEESQLKLNEKLNLFEGNGYHKLYSTGGLLIQEGEYINGILSDGKRYFYNENSVLIKTEIIENKLVVKTIQ